MIEAEAAKERLNEEFGREEGIRRYQELIRRAFNATREAANAGQRDGALSDPWAALDVEWTLNNLVYLAVLYLKTDSRRLAALGDLDLDRATVSNWVERLGGRTPDRISDRDIMHTIGWAWHLLGEADLAARAGERLFWLVASDTDDVNDPAVATFLRDAATFLRSRPS